MQPKFPNGFTSWYETHHEIVASITYELNKEKPNPFLSYQQQSGGTGLIWELAFELTNEFETMQKDRDWDGEFFDEIENFLAKKFSEHP